MGNLAYVTIQHTALGQSLAAFLSVGFLLLHSPRTDTDGSLISRAELAAIRFTRLLYKVFFSQEVRPLAKLCSFCDWCSCLFKAGTQVSS